MTTLWCGGVAMGTALLLAGARAAAAGPDYPRAMIEGASTCPEPREIWSALRALAAIDTVERRLRALPDGARPVEVADLGSAFRIRVGERTRAYRDDSRDCGDRAKMAALFVALAADSVDAATEAKMSGAATTALPPNQGMVRRQLAVASPPAPVAHLELGADGRLGIGASTAAPGALARVSWGRGRTVLGAGIRGSVPADATIGGVRVQQWRAAADLIVRARFLAGGPVMPFIELGAVAALLSVRAPDLAFGRADTAGELGFVVGGGIGFARRTWGAAFLLVEAEIDPDPPTLSVLPTGTVGRTPYVWLGAAAGVSLGLF